jgi:hypothetical protein
MFGEIGKDSKGFFITSPSGKVHSISSTAGLEPVLHRLVLVQGLESHGMIRIVPEAKGLSFIEKTGD